MTRTEKDTLGMRSHNLADMMNRRMAEYRKGIEQRDREKREAFLKRKSPILMANDMYEHF